MLKSIPKYCAAVMLLCLLPFFLKAQEPEEALPEETAEEPLPEADTATFRLEGVRIGPDVSRLLSNLSNPDSRYWEVNADADFGKYLLSIDWGTGRQNLSDEDLDYQVSGSYFRIGPDINFIADNVDNNALFIGLRYAYSRFNEQLTSSIAEPAYDVLAVDIDRQTSANWFELAGGLKARVWNNFYLAYTLRYKIFLNVHDLEGFNPYVVPGFGKRGEGSAFAFNYHLFYRIPFRRD